MEFNESITNYEKIIFGILIGCFFLIYSFYSFSLVKGEEIKFNSPYDTASYFFIKQFAQENKIGYVEPLLALSGSLAHPRSMSDRNGKVVPTIFLGFIGLVGFLGKLIGTKAILFFIPLCAACASYFFYKILCRVVSKRCAFFSTLLFLIHPAYWYFANHAMLPNVLLIDLFICGIFFLTKAYEEQKNTYCILGSFLLAYVITIRPPECVWIIFFVCVLFLYARKKIQLWMIISFCTTFFFVLSIYALGNTLVYGNPFSFGYKMESFMQEGVLHNGGGRSLFYTISNLFFPFGIHPLTIIRSFGKYGIVLFWWLCIPCVIGYVRSLQKIIKEIRSGYYSPLFVYTLLFSGVTLWLVIVYGSFDFSENITGAITPGTAYVRYWLPLFCFSVLYIVVCMEWLTEMVKKKWKNFFIVSVCMLFVFLSARVVLWQTNESLFSVTKHVAEYQKKSLAIQKIVPDNAIIFSVSSDKIFFPQRKAGTSFLQFAETPSLVPLMRSYPVYYYGLWNQEEIQKINAEHFHVYGFELQFVKALDEKEKLFKVVPRRV